MGIRLRRYYAARTAQRAVSTALGLTAGLGGPKILRVIRRKSGGVRWELQPDFAPLLEDVLRSPAHVIKESPVKQVTRLSVAGREYYIKRYLHGSVPLRPLKYLFKSTPARQEWELAQKLEERGIPVVRHLAMGEQKTWSGVQESVLITEGFDGLPINTVANLDLDAVLRFIDRMHERGVVQEDLHPANLLARKSPFELRLVDLHGTRVGSRLSAAERQRNLALLRIHLPIPVSVETARLSRCVRRNLLFERSKRCLRANREFGVADAGGLTWQVRLPPGERVRRVLDGPDEFLASRALILKPGRSATVGKADGLVLKRFNLRKVESLVKDLFRPSRAKRAFRAAYHLELAGIRTARPVAFAEGRRFRMLLRSYLLTEEVSGAVSLQDWLKSGKPLDGNTTRSLGELIGRLHLEGFSHRDLKPSNILLDGRGLPHLIDLDGLQRVNEITDLRAAADLDRLARGIANVTAMAGRTVLGFLRAYCRVRGIKSIPRRTRLSR